MPACSFCHSTLQTNLISCCISFCCSRCLLTHLCPEPLKIIPLPNPPQLPTPPTCCRCNTTAAAITCSDCKGTPLCSPCSASLHTSKFKFHQITLLPPPPSTTPLIAPSTHTTLSNNKPTNHSTIQTQISISLDEAQKTRVDLEHKWIKYRLQAKSLFQRVRLELDKKQDGVMEGIEREYKTQIGAVNKRVEELRATLKTYQSLQEIPETPEISHLLKQKATLFHKLSQKYNKAIETLPFQQLKVNQESITSIIQLIHSCKILQRHKLVKQLQPMKLQSTRDSSKSVKKLQKMEFPRVTPKHWSRESMVQEDCYGLNQSKAANNQEKKERGTSTTSNSILRKSCMSPRNVIVEKTNMGRAGRGGNEEGGWRKRVQSKETNSRSNEKSVVKVGGLNLKVFK